MSSCTHAVLHWTQKLTACAARVAATHGHHDTAERVLGASQRAARRLEELSAPPRALVPASAGGRGGATGASSVGATMGAAHGVTLVAHPHTRHPATTTTTNNNGAPPPLQLRTIAPPQHNTPQNHPQPPPLRWTRLRDAAMLPMQSKVNVVGMVNAQQGHLGVVERTTARGKTLWTVDLTDPDSPGWSIRAVFDGQAPTWVKGSAPDVVGDKDRGKTDQGDYVFGGGGNSSAVSSRGVKLQPVVGITHALVFKTENQRVMLKTTRESELQGTPGGGVVEAVRRAAAAVQRARAGQVPAAK